MFHHVPSAASEPAATLSPTDICGIVVSYNPDAAAFSCLNEVARTLAHTIVVDNASERAIRRQLRQLPRDRVTLLENAANLGVGTALNQGIRAAHQRGFRWFLLLDQDTRLLPESLAGFVAAQIEGQSDLGDALAFVGANFFHQCANGTICHALIPYTAGKSYEMVDHVITAGTLLGWASYAELGPFRGDFFIDHIDHEYCLRALARGKKVVRAARPLLAHRIGLVVDRCDWRTLWRRKTFNGYSPLRHYYQVRNLIVLAREYEAAFPAFIACQRRHVFKEARRSLVYEGPFLTHLRALWLGLQHGRAGRLGRFDPAATMPKVPSAMPLATEAHRLMET